MKDLVLKANELQSLMQFIGKIPTDYGMPIKQFFADVERARALEAEAAMMKAEKPAELKKATVEAE